MSTPGENSLLDAMDTAARELLKSVNAATIDGTRTDEGSQPIDLKGRVAAFEAVTSYLAVKHKIQPDEGRASGIDGYRDTINSRTPRRRGRGAASQGGFNGSAPAFESGGTGQ